MARSAKNTAAARQIEIIIRQLGSLSTLPQVAAGFLSHLASGQPNTAVISELIESDPALTARIFALAHQQGIVFAEERPSLAEAVAKLDDSHIRDAILSVKVFQAFEADFDPDSERVLPRKQLALHALATACCAKQIAALALPPPDRDLAFSAGLLHDIGKLAIDEVMPKSFERIVEQARTQSAPIHDIEQKQLGIDHTVIGKRLAEKWHLPKEIMLAIWLHHSDTEAITKNMPPARIAQVVAIADIIARQCSIGMSGSFDSPASITDLIGSLGLSNEQIDLIRQKLPEDVAQRTEILGLDIPDAPAAWCDMIADTAAKLSSDNTQLSEKNRQFVIDAAHAGFVNEFLSNIPTDNCPIEIAKTLALQWQKHFQTGPVCVCLSSPQDDLTCETVIVDNPFQPNITLLKLPDQLPLSAQLPTSFEILDAYDRFPWLFEQIDLNTDIARTKLVPLLTASGKPIGAIIFEHRSPSDPADQQQRLCVSTSIAAGVISVAMTSQQHSQMAEQFADLLGHLRDTREQLATAKTFEGIAEMAAGAGHELNNPLAVISGRAQILYDSETDENKKQMLNQIRQRSDDISQIVSDLMCFARPNPPVFREISIDTLIDAAIKQTAEKHNLQQMEVQFNNIEKLGQVHVDTQQIVSALNNVLSNALESYTGGSGPVIIDATCPQSEGLVIFQIIDRGCGMDTETLQKATQPFFSVKPAGRQRGMGLAHAKRLFILNNGSMSFQSRLDQGTTVTIKLPRL